jgi:hypothetical protein
VTCPCVRAQASESAEADEEAFWGGAWADEQLVSCRFVLRKLMRHRYSSPSANARKTRLMTAITHPKPRRFAPPPPPDPRNRACSRRASA